MSLLRPTIFEIPTLSMTASEGLRTTLSVRRGIKATSDNASPNALSKISVNLSERRDFFDGRIFQ